jgi:acetate kinase
MKQPPAARTALVLNVGSASLKAAHYVLPGGIEDVRSGVRETARIAVETTHDNGATQDERATLALSDLAKRMGALHEAPDVVAHRIVHGADRPGPQELTSDTLSQLDQLSALAPLHQPPALALVRAAMQRWPAARQLGIFDTSWHHTMPEKFRTLALPHSLYAQGVKRYGFHGLAFQSAMRALSAIAPMAAHGRVVLAHLGGGSSLCAVHEGRSVTTTMGMTPLGGIPMATRCGSLDPGVLLHLQRHLGLTSDAIDRLLWRESGLLGLSGETGDMRTLLTSSSDGARRAVEVYVASVVQAVASMTASIRGIDVLAFSGGIGMHAAEIRSKVAGELEWLGLMIDPVLNQNGAIEISASASKVRSFVLSIDEEKEMLGAMMPKAP